MQRYVFGRTLGEGSFGTVRLATRRGSDQQVAIKTLRTKFKDLDAAMKLPEVQALSALSHEHIVSCKEVMRDHSGHVHLVFEFLRGGNLEALTRGQTRPLSESHLRTIFFQLLQAIKHMHAHHYLHRDLKPENILLRSSSFHDALPFVKVADLGLSKNLKTLTTRPHTTYISTRWYRSPEILLRLPDYGYPSDMWAVGAVMAELVQQGTPLFPGDDEYDQLSRIINLRGHPSTVAWRKGALAIRRRCLKFPAVTPTNLADAVPRATAPVLQLVADLLEMDPTLRPTAAQALSYPVFLAQLTRNLRPKMPADLVRDGGSPHTSGLASGQWSFESDRIVIGAAEDGTTRAGLVTRSKRMGTLEDVQDSKRMRTELRDDMVFRIPSWGPGGSSQSDSQVEFGRGRPVRSPAEHFDLRLETER